MGFVGEWNFEKGERYYEINPNNLNAIPKDLREDWSIDAWVEE